MEAKRRQGSERGRPCDGLHGGEDWPRWPDPGTGRGPAAAPEGGFTAVNPETGVTTQGESVEESLANLREATALYLKEFPLEPLGRPILTTFEVDVHAA